MRFFSFLTRNLQIPKQKIHNLFCFGSDSMATFCKIKKNNCQELINNEHTKCYHCLSKNSSHGKMLMCVPYLKKTLYMIMIETYETHFTGKFCGLARTSLNLSYSIPRDFPTIMHKTIKHILDEFENSNFQCLDVKY